MRVLFGHSSFERCWGLVVDVEKMFVHILYPGRGKIPKFRYPGGDRFNLLTCPSPTPQRLIKWPSIWPSDFASVLFESNMVVHCSSYHSRFSTFFSIRCQQAALQVFGREIQHPSFAVKENGGVDPGRRTTRRIREKFVGFVISSGTVDG